MTRRGPRRPSSERRHLRNQAKLDRSWMVYSRCFICNRETCVNNYSDHKIRPNRKRGRILCGKCNYESPDWADEFLRMYDRLEKMGKLKKKQIRPRERFYRKRSDARPNV